MKKRGARNESCRPRLETPSTMVDELMFFQLVFCFLGHHVDGFAEVGVVGHGHCATVEAVDEEGLGDFLVVHRGEVGAFHRFNECVEGRACLVVELLLRYRVYQDVVHWCVCVLVF